MVLEVSVHPWRRDGGGMVGEIYQGVLGRASPRLCDIVYNNSFDD